LVLFSGKFSPVRGRGKNFTQQDGAVFVCMILLYPVVLVILEAVHVVGRGHKQTVNSVTHAQDLKNPFTRALATRPATGTPNIYEQEIKKTTVIRRHRAWELLEQDEPINILQLEQLATSTLLV